MNAYLLLIQVPFVRWPRGSLFNDDLKMWPKLNAPLPYRLITDVNTTIQQALRYIPITVIKTRWSRYHVIDFSHPRLKSTRQRAKPKGRDCPASVNGCSERATRLPPSMTLRPDIDFVNFPTGNQ